MSYQDFIAAKHIRAGWHGIEVSPADIHPMLYPFQRHCVEWACRKGRAALFADCGLGKSFMQIEWARLMSAQGKALIVAPLAVAQQTIREAAKLGVEIVYSRDGQAKGQITITNYEMVDSFDPAQFIAVVLDESSILKSYAGKTKQMLISKFASTPYRLACTATPAPNDHVELGNHSEMLGIMPQMEMLMRWFKHSSENTKEWNLKGHAAKDFWRWVSTWAISIGKPSDMGYSDTGFCLPALNIQEHVVAADMTIDSGDKLFRDTTMNATTIHREMKLTADDRAKEVAALIDETNPWIIWCNTNYEADCLTAAIPGAVELRGNETIEQKERKLAGFTDGTIRVLITKPSMAGFGLNWQHCANVAFVGLSYSYEQFYQAIRRCWRFGQPREVQCHVILGEGEIPILNAVKVKEGLHDSMRHAMIEAVQAEHNHDREELKLSYERDETSGGNWRLILGDSCQEIKSIPDESVDLSVFSPPFANLYIYSDSACDMGNCKDEAEFFTHFKYLVEDLYRITRPGRMAVIHCVDLPLFKWKDGVQARKDFPGQIISCFEDAGWIYHSRVTIWKDPVVEMQRTKSQGLLYKQLRSDSCYSRQGMADYLIIMRKFGDESKFVPVTHNPADFPLDQWQQWASPVWMDVRQTHVLNYQSARQEQDEKHICPLQLDTIERAVVMWSNPGEHVFSPFAGIGSEGYMSLLLGRKFTGIELKRSYYETACRHLARAEEEIAAPKLFDGVENAA